MVGSIRRDGTCRCSVGDIIPEAWSACSNHSGQRVTVTFIIANGKIPNTNSIFGTHLLQVLALNWQNKSFKKTPYSGLLESRPSNGTRMTADWKTEP